MDELLTDFIAETGDNLDALAGEIVAWEQAPHDRARLDGIFRFFHTVKGTCGFLDLPRLERLSHAAESALAKVRDGQQPASRELISVALTAIEAIRTTMDVLAETGGEAPGDDATLIAMLENGGAAGASVDFKALIEASPPGEAPLAEPPRRVATSVRVSIDLLERMMNTASELVLARNELVQKLSSVRKREADGLDVTLERLSASVGDLQEDIARTRMQPIEALWAPLPRMVRGLGDDLDKKIALELSGGDTELDRQLLEAMRDPIAHMLRNAADHGLETPAQRRRAGKPETGVIKVSARQASSQILIEIADDGRGLDIERLKSRAVRTGLIPASEAAQMSNSAAAQIIFEAGLSTADSVTSISGRGVGMDIVRANVERIGGTIEVESQPGVGTSFSIRVPLTLTIVPALIVSAARERFALAQGAIQEIVRLGRGGLPVEETGGVDFILLRGRRIPLIDLACHLKLKAEEAKFAIIVQSHNGTRLAMSVEAVHDHEELVVKPAAPAVAACGFFAGTSVLGDGRAILMLDISGFTQGIAILEPERSTAAEKPAATVAVEPMLLFDRLDSRRQAVPAGLISRIVEIAVGAVEYADGRPVVQIDGELVQLVDHEGMEGFGKRPVLLFDNGRARCGLMTGAVHDIVAEAFAPSPTSGGGAVYGIATLAGMATELIDVGWLLGSVAAPAIRDDGTRPHVLLLDADDYTRSLLKPLIETAGYQVTVAAAPADGQTYDLVISGSAEMPVLGEVPCLALGEAGGPLMRDRTALLTTMRSLLEAA